MSFADIQNAMRDGWKKEKQQLHPVRQRKANMCPKCGKQGYHVKMDYKGNVHQQMLSTVYDVEICQCPRCNHIEKTSRRMEGRGKGNARFNAGKEFGGL